MTRRRDRTGALLPRTTCKATSKRSGERCHNPPMKGQEVCRMHGGATKAARARAEERLLAATDPAAAKLVSLMTDRTVPYSVQLAAAKDILDRAGIGTKQELDVVIKPWQRDIHELIVDLPAAEDDDVVDAEVVEPEALPPPSLYPHDNVHPLRGRYGPVGGSTDGFSG